MNITTTDTRSTRIAVFIDFDNVEIGVKSTIGGQFDIGLVQPTMVGYAVLDGGTWKVSRETVCAVLSGAAGPNHLSLTGLVPTWFGAGRLAERRQSQAFHHQLGRGGWRSYAAPLRP